jgi:hypothetical protein
MRPAPRVQCDHCSFAWYGASAADGLRVVGACPRCGGELIFLGSEPSSSAFAVAERLAGVMPAAVLGLPMTWGTR